MPTNLTIIGTSHIAQQSINEIRNAVDKFKPDIIAIELDKRRYKALISGKTKESISITAIPEIGFKGYLFALIGKYIQQKLGTKVGIEPGADMLEGIKQAKENKLKLILIDQDITITLKKFSKAFNYKEKWHLIVDFLKAIFMGNKQAKELGISELNLNKVPSKTMIKKLLNEVKKRYPNTYNVLVEERNHLMAKNLIKAIKDNPTKNILAIVGAGHEDRILEIMKKIKENKIEYV